MSLRKEKIRKMNEIFPIGSVWRFKGILPTVDGGIVPDISRHLSLFNGPLFRVHEIERENNGYDEENDDDISDASSVLFQHES